MIEMINADNLFAWYDANETVVYNKAAVLEEVVRQHDSSGMTKYEARFSDGRVATYSYSVVYRYIIGEETVCTVDEDGIRGKVPEDWDELETIYRF